MNLNNPSVTVVVPTRNRRDFLAQCIDSVLSQEGVSWELIVIDDASTDGTWGWLQTLADSRVLPIHLSERSERAAARNRGLAEARGEYVMFLDDDDLLRPDALHVLAGALDANQEAVAAVGARWVVFTGEGYERRDVHPRRPKIRNVFDDVLFGWSAVSGQNLYRSALLRKVGGFDGSIIPCEDRDLWLRVAANGLVTLRPETVVVYRMHPDQSRPLDIRAIRERVARRAIRKMPSERRRRGLALRRSNHLLDLAEDALAAARFTAGLRYAALAVAAAPTVFLSPLIGVWVFHRLVGRAIRRVSPPRRAQ